MPITSTVTEPGIVSVTVDYPPVNAVPSRGWFELADAITAAGNDPQIHVVIRGGVKVASFALAPKPDLIAKLKEAGVAVIPSVGAAKPRRSRAVTALDRIRHGGIQRQQESGAHGHARRAIGQRRGQPATVEEPAGRHDRDVNRVEHRRQQQRGRPQAGVPAALAALDDHRVGALLS